MQGGERTQHKHDKQQWELAQRGACLQRRPESRAARVECRAGNACVESSRPANWRRRHLVGVNGGTLDGAVARQQLREVLIGEHDRQPCHEQRPVVWQAIALPLVHLQTYWRCCAAEYTIWSVNPRMTLSCNCLRPSACDAAGNPLPETVWQSTAPTLGPSLQQTSGQPAPLWDATSDAENIIQRLRMRTCFVSFH